MKTNQEGIDLIKQYEGFSADEYICPAGKPTIGYGHFIKSGESISSPISEMDAEELLISDLSVAEKAVSRLITVYLNQNQFSALVSFTYNLGAGALEESTLRRKLNDGQINQVPDEFLKWVFAGGKKLDGLVARRTAESELFQKV